MSADRHALYQRAVQSPEIDVELFDRVFRRHRKRPPLSLREDFCGTALLCAEWAQSDDERVATGVDRDPEVLAWSRAHVLSALDEDERERVTLVRGDVRALSARTFDIVAAPNFSWAILDDEALHAYLAGARACLEDDGLLALEIFGGEDLERALVHEHRLDGFTYVWEHARFDEAQRTLHAAIHFRFEDGSEIANAFRYAFVLRPFGVLQSCLRNAGFDRLELQVELPGARFRERARPPASAAWTGYLFALPVAIASRRQRRASTPRPTPGPK
ncbi:MAG: class I SAM-dependent methyltransferase [Sandaracinaceae bacterium]|nr:class I SAM-dependent methyltransferase [Sandaracinaceae bacterium]